jgi:hypothetical protein
MNIVNPMVNRGGRPSSTPILRSEIEEAQRNTNSNRSASKWLGVSYKRYKKYAELYGIFERHLNPAGVGVDKGWAKKPTSTPLKDILAGKHPKYSLARLKNRLIARNKIKEECSCCGFNEKRITDGVAPLMIMFKDGDHSNFSLDNLQLYCYNCMFLTTGAPSVVNRSYIEKSFVTPDKIPSTHTVPMTYRDAYDPTDESDLSTVDIVLTDSERSELFNPNEDE